MEILREINTDKIIDNFVEHGVVLFFSSDCQFSNYSMEDTLEYDEKSLKT